MYFGIDSILSRLELSTSKRTSKEDQSLLSLIRKLLSYFTHTPDWRLNNPLLQKDEGKVAEVDADASPPQPPPPPQPSQPVDWILHSLSGGASQALVAVEGGRPAFLRRSLSTAVRKRQRWKAKQAAIASRLHFDRKRRELRFLLTGVRGELPAAFTRPPKKEKEKGETTKDVTPSPLVKAPPAPTKGEGKGPSQQKPSIEELLRQMQEKERLRVEVEDKKKELKERRAKLERDLKEHSSTAVVPQSSTPSSLVIEEEGTDVDDSPSPTSVVVDDKAKKVKEKRAKEEGEGQEEDSRRCCRRLWCQREREDAGGIKGGGRAGGGGGRGD